MKGIFSIAIGGFGRGVINWFSYNNRNLRGSLEDNGCRILGVDGPEKDQYTLPGGYQIDTSDGKKEFFKLRLSPLGMIKMAAQGRHVPYISQWLSRPDALRVPNQSSMNPKAGGGGSRAIGHATFYPHADALDGVFREGLEETRGYLTISANGDGSGNGQALAIIKFSTVGAIGSGSGLDNAHLIKSIKDNFFEDGGAMLIGVIALPNAFDKVLGDPMGMTKRDAKSMALIRELLRFQHTDGFLAKVGYTKSISVENDQLFGLCFLIDGGASDLSLRDVRPVYGICPAVADLETALALDDRHIVQDLSNWGNTVIGNAPMGKRFATFGVHSYIFPRSDLLETFSLRFARDLYRLMVEPPEAAREEGRQLADELLGNISFTRQGLLLSNGESLSITPPVDETTRRQARTLIKNFTLKTSDAASFPAHTTQGEMLELSRAVKTRRLGVLPVHNQEVIDGCQNISDEYLGRNGDKPDGASVHAWVNGQAEAIAREFGESLAYGVQGIFYDPRTKAPLRLNRKPYVLVVARDYLNRLMNVLKSLESALWDVYARSVDDQQVIEKQRKAVEGLERQLLESETSSHLQKEYIHEYQKLLELQVWGIILKASYELAGKLRSIADRWWREVGEPSQSWYSLLHRTLEHLDAEYRGLLSVRTDMANVKVRRYFPSPGSEAEDAMYEALASERHSGVLEQMSFQFFSDSDERLGEPRREDSAYRLLLNMPDVDGYDPKVDSERLYDVVKGVYTNLMVESHSPYKIVQYGGAILGPLLSQIHLPEAMLYDYRHCWRHSGHRDEGGLKAYVAGIAEDLSKKAHVFLSQQPSGQVDATGGTTLKTFCLSRFRNLTHAPANSADELATLLAGEMNKRTGIHEVEGMDDIMICLNFMLGVSIYDWAYYNTCLSQYMEYLGDPQAEPIQLYPEEQNALELERLLKRERLLNGNYLSPSVTGYLGDMNSFSDLAMAYALSLLEVEKGELNMPDRYVVKVTVPGSGEVSVPLGNCGEFDSVIQTFLDADNEQVRTAVGDKLKSYLIGKQDEVGIEGLIGELRRAAGELDIPEGCPDRDYLSLAMRGVIYRFIRTIEPKQQEKKTRMSANINETL